MQNPGVSILSMTSPLGKDALLPTAFGLEEALSQPYICIVDLVSERETIDPDKLLHQPVCVSLQLFNTHARKVHGLVRRFAATGPLGEQDAFGYRAEIVPHLWFLSQTEDCRVFENKTTKQIVETILKEHEVPVSFRTGDVPARPFTMQYNESDLDFVSRLLQEEGWFYFFDHADGPADDAKQSNTETVIISDRVTSLRTAEIGTFALLTLHGEEPLASWHPTSATSFGSIDQRDYDADKSGSKLTSGVKTTSKIAGAANRQVYHWPAHTLANDVILRRTRALMEAAEAEATLSHGAGWNPYFIAGGRFTVASGGSETFVLHGVSHQANDETWRNAPNPPTYSNSFTAFPASKPWRPARTIQRPRMAGVYSATVTDDPDELGRVKVSFRWDHRNDATVGGGVRVRVMETWGGSNAGTCFIPRVGTEVAVSFMDGDPDRPVVMGQLRNDKARPPWPLPANKTRTGLRTRSLPDGGSEEFSELWFDDKKGEEQVMLHAQRDLAIEAENDATHDVGQNRTVNVRKGDDKLTVQQGNRTVDVPNGNHTIQSTTGDIVIKTTAGAVSVEALKSLTLKVGQSTVTLDQSGVTIKGMMVKVEGQLMTNLKGTLLQFDADGMLKAAGGVMMLN
jgi:type VI secretion system secreted protein VgrG